MSDIKDDLMMAHRLYVEAGVEGAEGARCMIMAHDEIENLRATNRELVAQIAKMHSDYGPVIEQVDAQVAAIKWEGE